jgi:transmembrane sensor
MGQRPTNTSAGADEEALAWIARLRADDVDDEDRQAFALWLASDQGNRRAMDIALDLWDDLGSVRYLPLEVKAEAANHRSWWAAAAVAASLVLAVLLWPVANTDSDSLFYQTALGERRTVTLEDNSRLTLNTNSRIRVAYQSGQRLLKLLRGEVYFEVASDPRRPFTVDTGSASVTAIGTAFNIRRDADAAEITVTKGVVRVTETGVTGNRAPASAVLHANELLIASTTGLHDAATADTDRRLAWQRGELVARELRLPLLAAELERYHDISILIADADVAAMTVSGVFQLDQPAQDLLQALELSLGLQVKQLDEHTIQLLKRAQ